MFYPLTKVPEVAEKYFEAFKKFPLKSFEKDVVSAIKMHDKEGAVAIAIVEVEKGKYEDALNLAYKRMLKFSNIEGFNYKMETLMTVEESLKSMGIVPPK
jgi:DNA-binding XRE family transcriptional regulator